MFGKLEESRKEELEGSWRDTLDGGEELGGEAAAAVMEDSGSVLVGVWIWAGGNAHWSLIRRRLIASTERWRKCSWRAPWRVLS